MDERRDLWWPSPTIDLGKTVRLDPPLEAVNGGRVDKIQVSYESWGELSAARDNAVLVIHPLAMDCHASGAWQEKPLGWWEPLIGPGRALDTDRYWVVCPNLIGGCYGTTGPRFHAPDGEPYLDRFPLLTPLDMMRVQRSFLRTIGVDRLHTVIGPSMGGMIAWEWAIEAGEQVDRVVVVAAPLRTTAFQIGLNWLQRRGIELDLSDDDLAARWGQMIARGVGMLSYRAPIGLEERFGREWFKKPGETLGKRGVYNVESWLRHHGKKAVRRFDPYTYLLFSRAMDLHDVGDARGGAIAALDRVRCPVVVVGISSDQLYPAAEVRTGADVLSRLGRSVVYEEIRSPDGHDAFLLETDQLGAILRGSGAGARAVSVSAPRKVTRTVRLGVLGAGKVSALLQRLFEERRDTLRERFGLRFETAVVAEIDRDKPLDSAFDELEVIHDPERLIERDDFDVLLDLTRGTGAYGFVERALEKGRAVVTPNKILIREHGDALERLALQHGVRFAYHNAIAAGWPLLYSIDRPLGREHVHSIQSVLSATCNVVLEGFERGDSLEAALAVARKMEITEPDPELDLSGWDTAQKLAILVARAFGRRFETSSFETVGLGDVDPLLVRAAPSAGYKIKLVGLFVDSPESPMLGVRPVAVAAGSHLGNVSGNNNVVVLDSADAGEMVYFGRGSGELPVATAVLGDLIGLYDAARSWTGRYPPARRTPRPPEFSRSLALAPDGSAKEIDGTTAGSLALLASLIHRRSDRS